MVAYAKAYLVSVVGQEGTTSKRQKASRSPRGQVLGLLAFASSRRHNRAV